MKNECDIVKDLLFSYNDDVLSKTSKDFVNEHLKTCKKCKEILKEIKQESTDQKDQEKDVDFLKRIKRNISKKNLTIFIFTLILIVVVLFNILVFRNYKEIASTMEVYLKDDITEQQVEDIKNKIMEKSENIELEYVSKESELNRMKSRLGENSNLLNDYDNQNNPFHASIQIKTDTKIQTIVENIENMPGIAHITTHISSNPYELYIQRIMKK